MIVPYLAECL
jgi:hypothetical protein